MQVVEYKSCIAGLAALMASWQDEYNGDAFGIVSDVFVFAGSLKKLIDDEDCVLLALLDDDKVVGIFGIVVFSSPLNDNKMANEHFWYVIPKYRGRGIKLIHAAFDWAKQHKCSHIILNASCLAGNLHDKVCSIYERLGMKKFETSYIKEI